MFVFNNRFAYDSEMFTERFFSVGVHPWDAALVKQTYLEDLKVLAAHPNCFAIGECGLDNLKGPEKVLQKTVFRLQLALAEECGKPVIIHCVKAFDELQEVCKPYMSRIPLIIHGFNKSSQLAGDLIEKGFYLSLNPSLFQKENFDFSAIPPEKLFLETDTNEYISIQEVYDLAALKFNMSKDELKEKISLNFERLK